jgi:uncharacterized membrane protein YeaQ/YmgE (transglycosylase-associated protein family)
MRTRGPENFGCLNAAIVGLVEAFIRHVIIGEAKTNLTAAGEFNI